MVVFKVKGSFSSPDNKWEFSQLWYRSAQESNPRCFISQTEATEVLLRSIFPNIPEIDLTYAIIVLEQWCHTLSDFE